MVVRAVVSHRCSVEMSISACGQGVTTVTPTIADTLDLAKPGLITWEHAA